MQNNDYKPTGSCIKCRPCQPRGIAGRRQGPGHSRYMTFVARNRPTWWTLTQLQFKIDALKFALPGPSTSATWTPPAQPRRGAFTTTKVPKFSGVTNWDQYRQVFYAIVHRMGGTTLRSPYNSCPTWRGTR